MTENVSIEILKDALQGPISSLLKIMGSKFKQKFQNRIDEYQHSIFKNNMFSKTILHRSEPKSLRQFYQPLRISKIANKQEKK